MMKAALQPSIHAQYSKLLFSSLQEYISISAERIQYLRERLAEAENRNRERLAEAKDRKPLCGFCS
jgi:hypothetical protein